MHHIYLAFFIFLISCPSSAQEDDYPKGYIHTKNNYQLTGYIGRVDHTNDGSMVLFVNDFGTPYYLHPALIKGFVFYEGPSIQAYESKQWENKWLFLNVLYSGESIRLLKTPEKLLNFELVDGKLITHEETINQYWLDLPGHRIQPLKKMGFRHQMRRLTRDVSPSLASKIGKKGYRFNDLYSILDEYDREWSKGKKRL